jgi:AcrR family transcriptional regulator
MTEQAQGTAGGLPVEGMPPWQAARRRRIVDAALDALREQEYEQIQIRDVAQAAGVALGTLYRYFSSKEHLYAAVLQEWAAFGGTRRQRAAGAGAAERVRRRTHAIVRAIERQPQFYKVFVLLRTSTDPNARLLLAEFRASAHASLAAELDVLGPDAEDCATMLWSLINTLVTESIYEELPTRRVHRVLDRFVDLLPIPPTSP